MSSHREAPAISKDPVADNTDSYAFVSPDDPGHGHDHRQLHAARGAVRRSELLRVRRRRPLPHQHRQRWRRRCRTSSTSSRSRRRSATRTRSSTTPARSTRSTARTGTASSSIRSRGSSTGNEQVLASNLACPPCNVGVLSTPNYDDARRSRPSTASPAVGPCSPGSGSRASTSTSARSSTWRTCARSRTCTSAR